MAGCCKMTVIKGLLKPAALQFSPLACTAIRCLSITQRRLGVDKALLSKLRKQTGIPFINCKKALEIYDNDFDQAKKWLQEEAQREGWAKATKLQSRPMSQGLVAVLGDEKHATMIEVNCETDFVARNEKFVSLVKQLLQECDLHFKNQSQNKVTLNTESLNPIVSSQQTTLGDLVALNVGNLGENMALRRAAFFRSDADSILSSYVHPSARTPQSLKLGKYGAVVDLKQDASIESVIPMPDLGSRLCQHVVGMNPQSIGEYVPRDDPPVDESEETDSSDEDSEELSKIEENDEDRLLNQEYLLDSTMTVGELTHLNGVVVNDFIRFACGEETEDEKAA